MEDENGLELSLGLSFGGSSGKSKLKDAPSYPTVEEGSSSRLIGGNKSLSEVGLKNFFDSRIENQDHDGNKKSDPVTWQHESFLTGLGKGSAPAVDCSNNVHNNLSQFSRYQELWISNKKTTDTEEEKPVLNKRKSPFEEMNFQKKHERIVDYIDTLGKTPTGATSVRNSHISGNTEDGSFGENEDVGESEAEGSNSWLVSQREDSARCSDVPKHTNKHCLSNPSGIGSQGQQQPCVSGNESQHELGKSAYGMPLSLQPLTVMTVPYPVPVKVPTASSAPNATGFPSPCVMQLTPLANSERPVSQAMNTSNMQLVFGYSPVQIPTLETNSSWAFSSQSPHVSSFDSKNCADGTPNSDHSENEAKIPHASIQPPHNSPAAFGYEGNSSNLLKGSGKYVGEVGTSSSSPIEDEGNGNNTIFRPMEAANRPVVEGFLPEGSNIRPGIASNVKFGGCGSYPDLPWVSTTGPGPNGKTISGVTYKYNKNQIKIVCACHGSHMSVEEFVQHASGDAPNPESNTIMTSFPSSNPTASAQAN